MKLFSNLLFGFLIAIYFPATAVSSQTLSLVEAKYQQKNPVLFDNYLEAKKLISLPEENREKLEEANIILTEIFEADNDFAPAYVEFARLLYKFGYRPGHIIVPNFGKQYEFDTWKLMEVSIEQALDLEPGYAEAYVLLARVHMSRYDVEFAREALRNATLLGSKSPWLYLFYADILKGETKWHASRLLNKVVIDRVITDKSAYHKALQELATNYQATGDYQTAEIWFQRAIEYQPTPTCLNNYANFLIYRKGDFKKAIEVAERSMEIAITDEGKSVLGTAYYARWALVKELSGESEAQPLFDKAHEIFPQLITAMGNLSRFPKTREVSKILDRKIRQLNEQGKPKNKA